MSRTQPQPLSQILSQRPLQAIPTSISSLDLSLHGGLVPGQLYEVHGLNNTGKPNLAAHLCVNATRQHKRVLWISMMQGLPRNNIAQLTQNPELVSLIDHARITTVAHLFLFLMQIQSTYGLLIIEDFAVALSRNIGDIEEIVEKPKVSAETRRNKTILDILKLLCFYCGKNKASCVLFNPVDTMSMAFVEVYQNASRQQIHHHHPSSQQHNPKPKKINQQVLISALGDHSSWNSYFRARIQLYRDWSMGTKTAVFANVKHSPAMRRVLQSKGIQPRVVQFVPTEEGLKEVILGSTQDTTPRHEFTLDEKDFESENEEVVPEDPAEVSTSELLPSSPCKDIQNAREMLSSKMSQENSMNRGITEEDLLSDIPDVLDDDSRETATADTTGRLPSASGMANAVELVAEKQSTPHNSTTEEHADCDAVGVASPNTHNEQPPDAMTKKTSVTSALKTSSNSHRMEYTSERVGPRSTLDDENGLGRTGDELENTGQEKNLGGQSPIDCEDHQEPDTTANYKHHSQNTQEDATDEAQEDDLRLVSMVSDTSIDVQEIDDELEELYPTQPEALSIVRLSQLLMMPPSKRSHSSLCNSPKRAKIASPVQEESQEFEDSIESTFPFY